MSAAAFDAEVPRVGSRGFSPFDLLLAHCNLVRSHSAASLAFLTVSILVFETLLACLTKYIQIGDSIVIQGMTFVFQHFTTTFASLH